MRPLPLLGSAGGWRGTHNPGGSAFITAHRAALKKSVVFTNAPAYLPLGGVGFIKNATDGAYSISFVPTTCPGAPLSELSISASPTARRSAHRVRLAPLGPRASGSGAEPFFQRRRGADRRRHLDSPDPREPAHKRHGMETINSSVRPDAPVRLLRMRRCELPPDCANARACAVWLLLLLARSRWRRVDRRGRLDLRVGRAPLVRAGRDRPRHDSRAAGQVETEASRPPKREGPRFPIERFEVTGNTLLTPSQVEQELAPFQGADKSLEDVQKARDALQKRYEAEGFLTVAVAIPQQTVESGVVRLQVLEARLGRIEVQNDGIDWLGEKRVRARICTTPFPAPCSASATCRRT